MTRRASRDASRQDALRACQPQHILITSSNSSTAGPVSLEVPRVDSALKHRRTPYGGCGRSIGVAELLLEYRSFF
ncbi:hypothetical protein NDU88_006495 [Pleurodeles waltl]|uniref:Uncharacterized protein n=1 Tax=Pleurodeles waltl TaxID=8319 RepID=A0AAV7MD15_PLEWA|nr:hypothetical protein NDU88_006495 [Pleurodeles waltl]